ncbi:MAG TPA: uracil-DNA glycosylase family protein [Terriglobia bacterium]|nr:uracil-DNA glycosylase family protein [Terriglobia bacterium]
MAKYLKRDYPDLNAVRIAVIGRHAASRPDNSYYRNGGRPNRFVNALYELLGVKDFASFKERFILTDLIRCHATGPHTPEKAMRNCARHLRNELQLFPNLDTFVVLGEDAYIGVERYLLGRDGPEIQPFRTVMGTQGWAADSVRIPFLDNREFRIFYCHHPSLGYERSPSIASMLE